MTTYPHGNTVCAGCVSCQPDRFPAAGVSLVEVDGRGRAWIELSPGGTASIKLISVPQGVERGTA